MKKHVDSKKTTKLNISKEKLKKLRSSVIFSLLAGFITEPLKIIIGWISKGFLSKYQKALETKGAEIRESLVKTILPNLPGIVGTLIITSIVITTSIFFFHTPSYQNKNIDAVTQTTNPKIPSQATPSPTLKRSKPSIPENIFDDNVSIEKVDTTSPTEVAYDFAKSLYLGEGGLPVENYEQNSIVKSNTAAKNSLCSMSKTVLEESTVTTETYSIWLSNVRFDEETNIASIQIQGIPTGSTEILLNMTKDDQGNWLVENDLPYILIDTANISAVYFSVPIDSNGSSSVLFPNEIGLRKIYFCPFFTLGYQATDRTGNLRGYETVISSDFRFTQKALIK